MHHRLRAGGAWGLPWGPPRICGTTPPLLSSGKGRASYSTSTFARQEELVFVT